MNNDMSNAAIIRELGARLKGQRVAKNIDQERFSYESGVSLRTLSRLENGQSVSFEAVIKVLRALDLVERLDFLVPTAEISPVQRAKSRQFKVRQRASRSRSLVAETKKTGKGSANP